MSNFQNNIDELVAGGILGAAFGAFLSKDKEEGAFIGALLGAAIAATVKASEEAKKVNIPQLVEDNGRLYEINSSGERRYIRAIEKSKYQFPEKFKLN